MNIVVTGGGTIAPIDDVRRITNASTGRFSAEITEACLDRGATVWHVHAPTALLPFDRSARVDLNADPANEAERIHALRDRFAASRGRLHLVPLAEGTVADYARTLLAVFREAPIDVAFLAMAVSDFEPEPIAGKIRSDSEDRVLRLRPTPKIIRSVRDWAPSLFLVGFKLLSGSSTEDLIERAEASGRENRADLTVANDFRTVRDGRHTIHLVRPGHPVETLGPDPHPAEGLVDRALAWAAAR